MVVVRGYMDGNNRSAGWVVFDRKVRRICDGAYTERSMAADVCRMLNTQADMGDGMWDHEFQWCTGLDG